MTETIENFPITITDEFVSPFGEWKNYDAVPLAQRQPLKKQRHTDIRSFVFAEPASEVIMLLMDQLSMFDLTGQHIGNYSSDADAIIIVQENEGWTFGTVDRQSDRNNWKGISIECDTTKSNLTTTQSVIKTNG